MAKTLKELTAIFSDFCEARQWHHEDPNQLITSLHIELAELAEHYQWQNTFPKWDKTEQQEVAFEFADVLVYLLRLAEKSGIDMEKAYLEKMPKLAQKFPENKGELTRDDILQRAKEKHDAYRKTGKNKLY